MAGSTVLMVDRRDPGTEGRDVAACSPASVQVSAAPTRYAANATGCAGNGMCPSRSQHPAKRRHPAAYVGRVPSDSEDSTALAIRLTTAGGICGSTAVDASPAPSGVLTAGVRAGQKPMVAA